MKIPIYAKMEESEASAEVLIERRLLPPTGKELVEALLKISLECGTSALGPK